MHASNFPFTGQFRGAGWNAQSLFAYGQEDTQRYILGLASKHDFTGLSETRGTVERSASLGWLQHAEFDYFFTDLDQYKGGIGLLVKRSFLRRFRPIERERDWIIIEKGRVGCLRLAGPEGQFHIYVCYFDPASKSKQCDCIKNMAGFVQPSAHSLFVGDFNFVHAAADHYVKDTGVWSMGDSKVVDDTWQRRIASLGIHEWAQDLLTCETGITISRLDRVYSSLHTVHGYMDEVSCNALDRHPQLSAHRPISFQLRKFDAQPNPFKRIPLWVNQHESFGEEVFAEYYDSVRKNGDDPFKHLQNFKEAVHRATRYIQKIANKQEAKTTDDKIAVSTSFLRALYKSDWKRARALQPIYSRLSEVPLNASFATSAAFRELQDLILELGHTSTKERIDELKELRKYLPEHTYHNRKNNILTVLRRLMPGSSGNISAMKDPELNEIRTDEEGIAELLTKHWQNVFSQKNTDGALRQEWLARIRDRMRVSLEELRPTFDDVDYVLSHLPSSSPGPDGIPFCVFKRFKEILVPILHGICQKLLDGTAEVPEDFNYAFLICLPKDTAAEVAEPSGTRPLSVVDASNRIIASILLRTLERKAASWISKAQRGFIKGRHMLRNVLDIDFAGQQISIKHKRGAIILFDFRAAFPSMSHDFMWDTLNAIGLPLEFVEALKCFYRSNCHFIKVGGRYFPSVVVRSGVRQGCPLSPILFALCADLLLREISQVLSGEEVARAFADDTAVVIADYVASIPVLGRLFKEFESISALSLNISKTVFIPLWPLGSSVALRTYIRELCSLWRDIAVKTCGKYLGFMIGPGSEDESWSKPLQKYLHRVEQWGSLNLGLYYNMQAYRTFIATVLSFVMQLAENPPDLDEHFSKAIRTLAKGPGNWITPSDAIHLADCYAFPCSFQDPAMTAMASKLRVIATIAPDCFQRSKALEMLQIEHGRRPFPTWHRRCFFSVLARCGDHLKKYGVTVEVVENSQRQSALASFQHISETIIRKKLQKTYFPEARIRQKLAPWKLSGIPAYLERRVLSNLALLREWCPPRVMAVYYRSVWGGWVTDMRMRSLLESQGQRHLRPCVLKCGWDEDSVYHYGRCEVFWRFLAQPRRGGLGIPFACRSGEAFLLLMDLCDEDKVRVALGMYALYRTVQYYRHNPTTNAQPISLLRAYLCKAHGGSKSSHLLRP